MLLSEMNRETLSRLRAYFSENWKRDRRERGCLLSTDGEVIPIANISRTPEVEFLQGEDGFSLMTDLVAENRLDCWCHSHPIWPAVPSRTDAECHDMPYDMLIYSCTLDQFGRYTVGGLDSFRDLYRRNIIRELKT